ncbi:hypothetical protein RchiOBHm_Chr4g0436051 [Rosa chinensis]|uniref:Uncharacterized protein n=1 Tax=Rosa chinensis TaxID=74649 RepID=A0A2P6R1X5_ROSCH|nr:hypothetical protein RchiOBHm_Chr4g0436051 [Rosa chinensis]
MGLCKPPSTLRRGALYGGQGSLRVAFLEVGESVDQHLRRSGGRKNITDQQSSLAETHLLKTTRCTAQSLPRDRHHPRHAIDKHHPSQSTPSQIRSIRPNRVGSFRSDLSTIDLIPANTDTSS